MLQTKTEKILFWVLVFVVLVGLAVMFYKKDRAAAISSLDELSNPAATETFFAQKWINVYGESPESIERYNIALLLRIVSAYEKRLKKLETTLPNKTKPTVQMTSE